MDNISLSNTYTEQLMADLAFISLLAGNDYLPKLRGFSLEIMWQGYLDLRSSGKFPSHVPLYDR